MSCGIGTEVGNGVKPEHDKPTEKATTPNTNESPEGGTPDVANSPDGSENNHSSETFDESLLLAPCATPFGGLYSNSPITLKKSPTNALQQTLYKASFDEASSSWTLKKDEHVLAIIKPTLTVDAFDAEISTPDGAPVASALSCETALSIETVTVSWHPQPLTQIKVRLKRGDESFDIKWFKSPEGGLLRIDTTAVGGSSSQTLLVQ